MPILQKFNGRTKAWVKFKFTKRGVKFLDVKQRNPRKPFKGIKIAKRK
tara:strand:+ start:15987 stop:16130 length:144 start_codon:yes stop_codon:yes gene_type:complete